MLRGRTFARRLFAFSAVSVDLSGCDGRSIIHADNSLLVFELLGLLCRKLETFFLVPNAITTIKGSHYLGCFDCDSSP